MQQRPIPLNLNLTATTAVAAGVWVAVVCAIQRFRAGGTGVGVVIGSGVVMGLADGLVAGVGCGCRGGLAIAAALAQALAPADHLQLEPDVAFLRQGPQPNPHLLHQLRQVDLGAPQAIPGQRVFQARQLQQVAHQLLQPQQFSLQAFHQHRIAAVHLGSQAVTHEQQGCQGGLEFVGHIAHPALLLFELGFQGAAALQHQGHPAAFAGQGEEHQLLA